MSKLVTDKWQERDEAERDLAYEAYMDHLADVYADHDDYPDHEYPFDEMSGDPDISVERARSSVPESIAVSTTPDVSDSLHELGDIATRVSKLEASSRHMATKAEVEQVKTEFVSSLSRNQKWIIGGVITTLVAIIGGLISFIVALFQVLGAS